MCVIALVSVLVCVCSQCPSVEASKFVLLPEGGDHSERIFGDAVHVASTALFSHRHQTPTFHQQPQLPRAYENIVTVPPASGVVDDSGHTFSGLIRRLPALPEYYRGRNLAVHRVVCISGRPVVVSTLVSA